MSTALSELLASLPARAQRQDSTNAQIADVETFLTERNLSDLSNRDKMAVANRMGAYDAADIFKLRASTAEDTTPNPAGASA